MSDFKVTLIGLTEEPELLSAAGALGCFEEKSDLPIVLGLKLLSLKYCSIEETKCSCSGVEVLPTLMNTSIAMIILS